MRLSVTDARTLVRYLDDAAALYDGSKLTRLIDRCRLIRILRKKIAKRIPPDTDEDG